MTYKSTASMLIMLLFLFSYSQDKSLSAMTIAKELKENANAVVRKNEVIIELSSQSKMVVKKHRIATVYNKTGSNSINARIGYDNTVSIKFLEAKIYNALGHEIKKIKKKDFIDVSTADGFSIYTDDRVKYLKYIPNTYPYTVEYIEETSHTSTAYIRSWYPIEDYYTSIEREQIIGKGDV